MTDRETTLMERVDRKVDALTEGVNDLKVKLEKSLERETGCRSHVQAIHSEVFGIDGDPQKPGLKGQMRDVRAKIDRHEDEMEEIAAKYKGGLRGGWMLLVGIVCAIIGAAAKHYWP